ncbi:MAG TPA: asparagine synthase C-terminal domain-containing protein, partial [Cytophagaceae bacterium]|nr:asparagine synthase C-terminal domain-containing protein [Cytophagaceae bacterium]
KVLPGHYILYKGGEFHEKKYWNPFDKIENTDFKYNDEDRVMDDLEKLLTSSFQYRMVSDVPVGIFLSGGIDSSLVSSILQKSYGNINTFTIGFDNPRYNEAVYAKEVAKYIGSRHHEFILEAKKAKEYLYNFYDIYDEPFSDSSGIPTVLISEICRKEGVKVVLSADGGDELFCGYTHYEKIAKRKLKLDATSYTLKKIQQASIKYTQQSGILRKSILFNLEHKVLTYLDMLSAQDDISLYETSISNQSSEELKYLLVKESQFKSTRYEGNTKFFLEKMMLWDLLHYLPDDLLVKVDRATMYNSIEGREPFLDHRIVEYSLNLPLHYKIRNGNNKYILKKILSRYIPSHLYDRPKKGFSIPIFQWFNEDLNHLFSEYITEEKLNKIEVLNTAEVMREMKKYNFYAARNQEYNIEKMWRTLSFIMWWDKWNN